MRSPVIGYAFEKNGKYQYKWMFEGTMKNMASFIMTQSLMMLSNGVQLAGQAIGSAGAAATYLGGRALGGTSLLGGVSSQPFSGGGSSPLGGGGGGSAPSGGKIFRSNGRLKCRWEN